MPNLPERNTTLWQCIGSHPAECGKGLIYTYRMRPEMDFMSQLTAKTMGAANEANNKLGLALEIPLYLLVTLMPKPCSELPTEEDYIKRRFQHALITFAYDTVRYHNGQAGWIAPRPNPQNYIEHLTSSIPPVALQPFGLSAFDLPETQIQNLSEASNWVMREKRYTMDADLFKRSQQQYILLTRLGYRLEKNDEGIYCILLPDHEALLTAWDQIRTERLFDQDWPEIDIETVDGIADDEAFIRAFLSKDRLLSNDDEFVHDHLFHVLRLIFMIASPNQEALHQSKSKPDTFATYYLKKRDEVRYTISLYLEALNELREEVVTDKLVDSTITQDHIEIYFLGLAVICDLKSARDKYDDFSVGDYHKLSQLVSDQISYGLAKQAWESRFKEQEDKSKRELINDTQTIHDIKQELERIMARKHAERKSTERFFHNVTKLDSTIQDYKLRQKLASGHVSKEYDMMEACMKQAEDPNNSPKQVRESLRNVMTLSQSLGRNHPIWRSAQKCHGQCPNELSATGFSR